MLSIEPPIWFDYADNIEADRVPFIYLFHKTRSWVRLDRGEPYCCFNLYSRLGIRRRAMRLKFAECYMTRSIYNITNSSLAWYYRLQGLATLWCSKPIGMMHRTT
jgi:hypothetical protein